MRDGHRRNDPVGAHSLRDRHYGSNVYHRHDFFDFLDERCTATRAGSSGGGEDGGGNPGIEQVHGNGVAIGFGIGN